MSDELQRRLDELRHRVNQLAEEAASGADIAGPVAELEQSARTLLADAKNTPQESAAQGLFSELARLSNPATAGSMATAATIRGLLRRARIRIEIAGDNDDVDEAIDILEEALGLNPENEEVIGLLQEAASRSSLAAKRVEDMFSRYDVEAPPSAPEPEPESPAPTQIGRAHV